MVAVSGAVDYLTNGVTTLAVPGGDPVMTQVTGTGCALGATMAAFAAVVTDPLIAAAAASALYKEAGGRAAAATAGPGSWAVRFLDELAELAKG